MENLCKFAMQYIFRRPDALPFLLPNQQYHSTITGGGGGDMTVKEACKRVDENSSLITSSYMQRQPFTTIMTNSQ